jgi:hypothetical protein
VILRSNGSLDGRGKPPNILRAKGVEKEEKMRWAGNVALCEIREIHMVFWLEKLRGRDHLEDLGILVGKAERKRPLGRPRCRWEDNIKMNLKEIEWEGMDWMHVAQQWDQWQAFGNTVMNLCVLERVGNFLIT